MGRRQSRTASSWLCATPYFPIDRFRAVVSKAASVLGKNYAGTLGVDGWARLPLLSQGSDPTETCTHDCCHRAVSSYWKRPRAGRCASHAWSRPSSGTPSPKGCAIGACWRDQPAWILRVAKGRVLPLEDEPPAGTADSPILVDQRFGEGSICGRYRDNLFVFLDRGGRAKGHSNYLKPAALLEQDIGFAPGQGAKSCGGGVIRERGFTGPDSISLDNQRHTYRAVTKGTA